MKRIVLDTSVVVKWFSQEKGSEKAKGYLKELEKGKVEVYLPELVKYELGNVLLKGKKLSFPTAMKGLTFFHQLPVNFVEENIDLMKESYKLAQDLDITYYDACFLSLAKKENAVLITANPRHQKPSKGIKVEKL